MTEPELNEKGYPKILDKVLEYTGQTYDDIEEMKRQEREEFSHWVDIQNMKKRIERGEMPMLDTDDDEISLKFHGGHHESS
jgi:hypothetical protein